MSAEIPKRYPAVLCSACSIAPGGSSVRPRRRPVRRGQSGAGRLGPGRDVAPQVGELLRVQRPRVKTPGESAHPTTVVTVRVGGRRQALQWWADGVCRDHRGCLIRRCRHWCLRFHGRSPRPGRGPFPVDVAVALPWRAAFRERGTPGATVRTQRPARPHTLGRTRPGPKLSSARTRATLAQRRMRGAYRPAAAMRSVRRPPTRRCAATRRAQHTGVPLTDRAVPHEGQGAAGRRPEYPARAPGSGRCRPYYQIRTDPARLVSTGQRCRRVKGSQDAASAVNLCRTSVAGAGPGIDDRRAALEWRTVAGAALMSAASATLGLTARTWSAPASSKSRTGAAGGVHTVDA